jgi:subtilisin family serine protease
VEPDLEQTWPYVNKAGEKSPPVRIAGDDCTVNEPDRSWPAPPDFAWHLDDQFSQLKKAREAVGETGDINKIRICIADTGYDPDHVTRPRLLNERLGYNFVEGNNDARDPGKRGILYNPGHGTGTLGILAGNWVQVDHGHLAHVFSDYLGGSPHAEIIPVRISSSVVHFWTSTMARGIDYAAHPGPKDTSEPPCHVLSISMGGLPSRAWAAAVNSAYDAGVLICSAAGNNFGGLPTRRIVWPARFARVIAALGVTADKTPYYKAGLHFKMQGNYGPPAAMKHALAAFTPNAPWAELGCGNVIDLDGAGTSSATPQLAAAAALWLAKHKDKARAGWRRVEAARLALFSSAFKGLSDNDKYFGNGVLRAFDALAIEPRKAWELSPATEDDVTFPFLYRLTGWDAVPAATKKMYEVEAAQIYAGDDKLQSMYPELESGATGTATTQEVVATLLDHPNVSHAFRGFLMESK